MIKNYLLIEIVDVVEHSSHLSTEFSEYKTAFLKALLKSCPPDPERGHVPAFAGPAAAMSNPGPDQFFSRAFSPAELLRLGLRP